MDSFVQAIANDMNVCKELEENLSIIATPERGQLYE